MPLLEWMPGMSVHRRLPVEGMCDGQEAMWPRVSDQQFMFFCVHLWGHSGFLVRGNCSEDRDPVLGDCPSPTLLFHWWRLEKGCSGPQLSLPSTLTCTWPLATTWGCFSFFHLMKFTKHNFIILKYTFQ